jgi:hypothetical protein
MYRESQYPPKLPTDLFVTTLAAFAMPFLLQIAGERPRNCLQHTHMGLKTALSNALALRASVPKPPLWIFRLNKVGMRIASNATYGFLLVNPQRMVRFQPSHEERWYLTAVLSQDGLSFSSSVSILQLASATKTYFNIL